MFRIPLIHMGPILETPFSVADCPVRVDRGVDSGIMTSGSG